MTGDHDGESHIVESRLPCPQLDCISSDGYHLYSDGHGWCFSCNRGMFPKGNVMEVNNEELFSYEYVPYRGITKETQEFFRSKTKIDAEGKPVSVGKDYGNETYKVKSLVDPDKIYWVGRAQEVGLYGENLFSAGSAKSVTVTEGEEDAESAYQMLGSKYPAVSVGFGAAAARKACAKSRNFLNSFERIYICFDNDKPGSEAASAVAQLFDFNKVFHVKLSKHKDANDYLQAEDVVEFRNCWYNARKFIPENIISTWNEFDAILADTSKGMSLPVPFSQLHADLDGLQTGCCILIKGQEGNGKTELLRTFESHVLDKTDFPVGIIHLEEGKKRNLQGLAGHALSLPVHLRNSPVSVEEAQVALRKLTKREDRLFTYSHFGSDDPHIIVDNVRFLASVCGCKLITLDPFNHTVTGCLEDDLRKLLDMMIMSISTLAQDHDFAFVYTAHTNPDGSTRDSKMLSKAAHVVIDVDRNPLHESEYMRRLTQLIITKNRPTSVTGPSSRLIFNPETFMLTELTEELPV